MEVSIELIRPSPYQPRLYFDIEELKASIDSDGMLVPVLVREKPSEKTRYEIVDGERRWRAAKELNWRQIPAEIRNVDDETARRMVYTLNEERQPYTLEENTKFFRRMYDQMGSVYAVSQAFKRPQQTIWNYVNISILPEHFQKAVWSHEITTGFIQEMEPLFTEARSEIGDVTQYIEYQNSPAYQRIIALCERIYTKEIKSPKELRNEYVDPYLATLDRAKVTKVKEELERIVPVSLAEATVKMETPEDLEKAAEALKREAQRQREEAMTPEEIATLEAEKKAKAEAWAVAKARREEEAREKVKEELLRNPSFILQAKAMEARSRRLREREAERAKGLEIGAKAKDALDNRLVLMKASIEEMVATVEESSVDVIITDPPYSKEYLECFSFLARFAFKALKPGKSLLVMVGQSYLPEVFRLLGEQISYHWTLAYLTPGGQSPQIWPRKINTFWKPVIWLTKGKYEGEDWHGDVFNSDVNDNDKRFHHWGQSESGVSRLVEVFSKPDDVVCDPFLGGGTTAVVAIRLGRKFTGSDIDESVLETCRRRVVQSYE